MADKESNPGGPQNMDPAAGLEQIQTLLKAKDDTSRFVGLALLKSVLDNHTTLRDDQAQILRLWECLSPKFLDRLLRAGQSQKVSKQEAIDMASIAVAVLHIFASLLPVDALKSPKFVGRCEALVTALLCSADDTLLPILQTLLTACSSQEGGQALMNIEDLSSLTELAPQQPVVLDVIAMACSTATSDAGSATRLQSKINELIENLTATFKNTDGVTFLTFIGHTIPRLPSEALPRNPKWIAFVVQTIRALVGSRPTSIARSAYTSAAAAILQAFPMVASPLLFGSLHGPSGESKPFSYLFINLLLIDIRSSMPSLLSKLNGIEYPAIARRLSAAYDVNSTFIGFLVRSLDDVDGNLPSNKGLSMPPDLTLKLRKDIAETMSLTIEYLRDRWDASVAGVAGLDHSARTGTSTTSEGTRLTLTWESMEDNVSADPLILASIRTLAIWLREDENENLRSESLGLSDMLIELYQQSSQGDLDFRYPILMAFEGLLISDQGVETFLAQNGWEVVTRDLISIIGAPTKGSAGRGIETVRLLLAIIDSDETTQPREHWMNMVAAASSMRVTTLSDADVVEFQIAVLQLATALLDLASAGMQKRHLTKVSAIIGLANQISSHAQRSLPSGVSSGFIEPLQDVVMSLENLR